ncbi:MAG: hypothetical protein ABI867_45570 [Kofleriaceae bacterium]
MSDEEDRIDRIDVRTAKRRTHADDDETVPKLPRGPGFSISTGQLVKIVMTAALLVMLIVIQRPCADGVSKFVTDFDERGSASATMPRPGTVDRAGSATQGSDYELLRPDMTEAETRAAIERAKAKAAGLGSGSGSGSAP